MTICIAAMAAKSKAIVCIADRAVTYSSSTGGVNSQSDGGVQKIIDLASTGWVALVAGNLPFAQRVTDRMIAAIGTERSLSRLQMQKCATKAYQDCLEDEVTDQVLTPNLLTRDDLLRRPAAMLPLDPQYVMEIARMIAEVRVDCALIVCGFDLQGPHIFRVKDGGGVEPCDLEGYAVIGGGEDASRGRIIWSETDRSEDLESVMYDVFDAKVAAEIIQGVGYTWDWKILVGGKRPQSVPDKISDVIDRLWISTNRSPYAEKLGKREMPPSDWKKRLSDFAAKALATAPPKRSASRQPKAQQSSTS